MILHGPGWIHGSDEIGESSDSPEGALIAWLRHVRGCCDDDQDEREIDLLDKVEHVIHLMELRTLKTEEERESEMCGMDDPDHMAGLPIGGTYYHETKRRAYVTTVEQSGDESAGALTIRYTKKVKP